MAPGTIAGTVNAKFPGTLAMPPLRTELLNACPRVIAVAVGRLEIEGVALATTRLTVLVTGET